MVLMLVARLKNESRTEVTHFCLPQAACSAETYGSANASCGFAGARSAIWVVWCSDSRRSLRVMSVLILKIWSASATSFKLTVYGSQQKIIESIIPAIIDVGIVQYSRTACPALNSILVVLKFNCYNSIDKV